MSGFLSKTPPPIMLGGMSSDDQDGAWGINCTANMQARGTTISSVGTPVVTRQDGVALGSGDLTVSGAAVLSTATEINGVLVQPGYGFRFSATTHGNVAVYLVGFPLTLASGDVITRWCNIPSLPTLG